MLFTYVHHKEYSNTSWDVAHLYEHLVTHAFQSYLNSLNIYPGLIGHVSGDTFEHIVFLNATFYNKQVADAYERFLATSILVDIPSIAQILLEIEAEEKVTFTIRDKAKFDEQLRSITTEPWISNDSLASRFVDETAAPEIVLRAKRTAEEFRDGVVGIYADVDDLDNDEQTLFLRVCHERDRG